MKSPKSPKTTGKTINLYFAAIQVRSGELVAYECSAVTAEEARRLLGTHGAIKALILA